MMRSTTTFRHQRSKLPSTIQSIRRRLYWACFFFLIGFGSLLFLVGHYWVNRRHTYPTHGGTGLTLTSQYTYLSSQITRINHSVVKIIPLTEDGLRPYPPFVEHHITRYSKGKTILYYSAQSYHTQPLSFPHSLSTTTKAASMTSLLH